MLPIGTDFSLDGCKKTKGGSKVLSGKIGWPEKRIAGA